MLLKLIISDGLRIYYLDYFSNIFSHARICLFTK